MQHLEGRGRRGGHDRCGGVNRHPADHLDVSAGRIDFTHLEGMHAGGHFVLEGMPQRQHHAGMRTTQEEQAPEQAAVARGGLDQEGQLARAVEGRRGGFGGTQRRVAMHRIDAACQPTGTRVEPRAQLKHGPDRVRAGLQRLDAAPRVVARRIGRSDLVVHGEALAQGRGGLARLPKQVGAAGRAVAHGRPHGGEQTAIALGGCHDGGHQAEQGGDQREFHGNAGMRGCENEKASEVDAPTAVLIAYFCTFVKLYT